MLRRWVDNLTVFLGFAIAISCFADAAEIPATCVDSIRNKGICTIIDAPVFSGPFTITYYRIVPTQNDAVEWAVQNFFDFESWGPYLKRSGTTKYRLIESAGLTPNRIPTPDHLSLQYYETEAETPVGLRSSSGIVKFNARTPLSYQFELVPNGDYTLPDGRRYPGAKALSKQFGTVDFFNTDHCGVCQDGEGLMLYKVTIETIPSSLPQVAAQVSDGYFTALWIGMFNRNYL